MNLAYLFNCMHTSVIRFVWSAVACIVNIALKISPKKKKKTCEEIILKWFCLNDGWQAKLVCTHSTPFFLRTCYLALAQLCSQGWKDKKAHKALSEFFFFFCSASAPGCVRRVVWREANFAEKGTVVQAASLLNVTFIWNIYLSHGSRLLRCWYLFF